MSWATPPYLGLHHGEAVGAHLRHHAQDVGVLVLPEVLHETVQGHEGPGPPDARTEETQQPIRARIHNLEPI